MPNSTKIMPKCVQNFAKVESVYKIWQNTRVEFAPGEKFHQIWAHCSQCPFTFHIFYSQTHSLTPCIGTTTRYQLSTTHGDSVLSQAALLLKPFAYFKTHIVIVPHNSH